MPSAVALMSPCSAVVNCFEGSAQTICADAFVAERTQIIRKIATTLMRASKECTTRVFFEPTESSREGLLYFGLIPNGNCYRNDVVIHLALWNKQQQDYVGIFRLSSRSSYECAVIVEKEDSAEFLREYNASQKFLKKYSNLERDYNFAPKSDAFKNIEDAKAVVFPNDEHTLRGEFVFGKKYTRCMKYTLEDVVKG